MASICNAMTVDVEDYFQVQAFANCIDRSDWDAFPPRVDHNTNRILDQFEMIPTSSLQHNQMDKPRRQQS